MCHMKTIQDTMFYRKEVWGESIGRSGEEEGPESLDGAWSSAAARGGAARSLRQWIIWWCSRVRPV